MKYIRTKSYTYFMGSLILEGFKCDGEVSISDNRDIFCDFEKDDCPLKQEKVDDQEDWRILDASLDEKGGVDHTTKSGENHVYMLWESFNSYSRYISAGTRMTKIAVSNSIPL